MWGHEKMWMNAERWEWCGCERNVWLSEGKTRIKKVQWWFVWCVSGRLAGSYFKLGHGKKAVCACYLFGTSLRQPQAEAAMAIGQSTVTINVYLERWAIISGPSLIPNEQGRNV